MLGFLFAVILGLYYRGHAQVLNQMVLDNQHHMLLSGVSCNGNEQSLFSCIYTDDKGDCDDWEDHVYIVCDAGLMYSLCVCAQVSVCLCVCVCVTQ